MSGICAIFHRDGHPVNRENLYRMLQAMPHRGPDDSELWCGGPVGLAHAMLHTTPESLGERLPYADPDSGVVITADARIDNREELFSKLSISHELRQNLPDSQLILRAYLKWQRGCVDYLLGDFAFIIWDRERQSLFCARDHLGIKPLYYYPGDSVFVIASEANVISQCPGIDNNINEGRIADFLLPDELEGLDKSSTFYEHIFRLPPAHTLVIDRRRMDKHSYWEPDCENEIRFKSDSEYVEAFSDIFTDSVRARLRCNTTPGLMLSGGIDSSSIVGMVQQIKQECGIERLPVYSVTARDRSNHRDSSHVDAMVSQAGHHLESFQLYFDDLDNYSGRLESLINKLAEPFDGMLLVSVIYLLARDHGRSVVIDGVEGDAIHSLPMSYPASYLKSGQWRHGINEAMQVWGNHYQRKPVFLKSFISILRLWLVTDAMRRWKRKYFQDYILTRSVKRSAINLEFSERINIMDRLRQSLNHSHLGGDVVSREYHKNNILHPGITVGIERYERVAALCGIEPRHPLLDKRLVEFSLGLPWEQKVRHGWSKYIIRRACADILPEAVVWNQGWGDLLGWPLTRVWIQKHFKQMVEVIKSRQPQLEGYMDASRVKQVVQQKFNPDSHEDTLSLWYCYSLANWLTVNQQL